MNRPLKLACAILATTALLGAACSGDDNDNGNTPTPQVTSEATRTAGPATSAATTSASTPAPGATSAPPSGRTFTLAEATALLDAVVLRPADLPGQWTVMTDTTTDNAAAATANPETAASNDRCGRLLGRTLTNQPADLINAFLGGDTLSYFTNATVYATEAGAIDCSAEAAGRLAQPGALARQFGSLFTNPDAVVVTVVDYPAVGDGSFAATLSGEIIAQGAPLDLTILLVAWREGNVTIAVGSARSGSVPPVEDLTPLVDLVQQRVVAGQ